MSWNSDGQAYCQKLAPVLEKLILHAPDQQQAMSELAKAAEAGDLIFSENHLRTTSPEEFVADLLLDNPAAADWMSARLNYQKGYMPQPKEIKSVGQIADRLK